MVPLEASTQDPGLSTECLKNAVFQVVRPRPVTWYQNMGATPLFTKTPVGERNGLDLTHSSAFHPVGPDYRSMRGWVPSDQQDDTTQVTWSSAQKYICSVTVSKSTVGWNNRSSAIVQSPPSEESSSENKTVKDEDDEDEEIDVGDSYDNEVAISSDRSDLSTSSADQMSKSDYDPNLEPSVPCKTSSSNESILHNDKPILKPSNFPKYMFNNDTLSRRNSSPAVYVHSKEVLKKFSDMTSMEYEISAQEVTKYSDSLTTPIKLDPGDRSASRKTIISSNRTLTEISAIKHEQPPNSDDAINRQQAINSSTPSVIRFSPELLNSTENCFNECRRNSENLSFISDISSPGMNASGNMGSNDSLCSAREDLLQRRSTFASIDYLKPRSSIASYSTGSSESLCSSKGDVFERRKSFGSIDYAKVSLGSIGSCPTDSTDSLASISGEILHRRLTLCSLDLKRPSGSLSSYRTDSSESICSNNGDKLQWRSRVGSADCIKRPNVSSYNLICNARPKTENTDDFQSFGRTAEFFGRRESIISTCNQNINAVTKVAAPFSKVSEEDKEIDLTGYKNLKPGSVENIHIPVIELNSGKNNAHVVETVEALKEQNNLLETVEALKKQKNVVETVEALKEQKNEELKVRQQRESVVVDAKSVKIGTFEKDVKPLFSPEDVALRSRVLILLWVLLGERRLREVGYPVDPVHRILWRAVDVCCSVAGVKSAAAVPLNADHDCGSDMLCFRDHAHRFLEVCAPTREHWKQFGWASLTVDAVARKIYDEELIPLLRVQSLPPDIQKAAAYLAQLDRPSVMVQNNSSQQKPRGNSNKQPLVIVSSKKKRGRPAKITHKVEEGGRIERVMLWRFLLNLLEDPKNAPCIHWVQRDEGIFRILNTDWLARLWGRRHGNPRMTYEKMARAMRTYYRSKVLQPVPRLRNLPRKLVYKFNPAVIHKVAAMKLTSSTFSGRGMNYNK